jgi:2-hydroxychromene-2-carboxylate isomerase
VQNPVVHERLLRNAEQSVARGTFCSPTFFVAEEIFFGKESACSRSRRRP